MSVMRWDPFREMATMREVMDRLFEEGNGRQAGGASVAGPALDVAETAGEFTVRATLPGLTADDVEISVLGATLRLSGETKSETQREGERWLLRERRHGRFERAVTLPAPIKAEAAQATFDNGVLTLTLPKADVARPRQIKVQGATSQPQTIDVASGEGQAAQD